MWPFNKTLKVPEKRQLVVLASNETKYQVCARMLISNITKGDKRQVFKVFPGMRLESENYTIRRARKFTDVIGTHYYQLVKYDDYMKARDAQQIILHWEQDNALYKNRKKRTHSSGFKKFIRGLFKWTSANQN